jgi:uncharacterized protein
MTSGASGTLDAGSQRVDNSGKQDVRTRRERDMSEATTTSPHPNARRAEAYLEAFGAGDLVAAADHFADDIVWRVGGFHPLSGVYRGKTAVLDYLRSASSLTDGSLSIDPESILASDDHLAMFVRVQGSRDGGGRTLDTNMAQIVKVGADGKWAEYWALSDDQGAIDAFWA